MRPAASQPCLVKRDCMCVCWGVQCNGVFVCAGGCIACACICACGWRCAHACRRAGACVVLCPCTCAHLFEACVGVRVFFLARARVCSAPTTPTSCLCMRCVCVQFHTSCCALSCMCASAYVGMLVRVPACLYVCLERAPASGCTPVCGRTCASMSIMHVCARAVGICSECVHVLVCMCMRALCLLAFAHAHALRDSVIVYACMWVCTCACAHLCVRICVYA